MTRFSVFDLDRTLTRRGTYLSFLVFAAARLRPWRLTTLPAVAACMIAYKLGAVGRKRLKELMQRLLLGPSLAGDDARRIARRFAARLLARGLRPQARARIADEHGAGRGLVIATAAPDLYAQPLADLLGVEHVLATRCAWTDDRLLSRIAGANHHGPEKLARFRRFLADQGLARDAVHLRFFSDDASDRPLLEHSEEPFAVNPGRSLRRLAREKGWPVLDWNDDRPGSRAAPD